MRLYGRIALVALENPNEMVTSVADPHDFQEISPGGGDAGASLLFILGRGRSGTTLLSRLLGSHPEVLIPPEGFFILNLWSRYQFWDPQPDRVEDFLQRLLGERRIASWGIQKDVLKDLLLDSSAPLDFSATIQKVYQAYAESEGRDFKTLKWLGDKNPHYTLFSRKLADAFPQAKFILMHRDYWDNVHSYQAVPFDYQSTEVLAARWRLYNKCLLLAENQYPERCFRLSYEQLALNPEETLERLCAFLGIASPSSGALAGVQGPQHFFGEGNAWHERLKAPVDSSRVGVGEGCFTGKEKAVIYALCEETARILGYEGREGDRSSGFKTWSSLFAGLASVWKERIFFQWIPLKWRLWLLNRHREKTGNRI